MSMKKLLSFNYQVILCFENVVGKEENAGVTFPKMFSSLYLDKHKLLLSNVNKIRKTRCVGETQMPPKRPLFENLYI